MNLYDLTGEVLQLQELLESDEVVDAELLKNVLADTTDDYEIKLEAYAKVIKNLSASVDAIKFEVDRLTTRKKAIENNITALKNRMYESMKATGTTKVKGDIFTISIQKNGGSIPVIVDVDTSELPDDLVKIEEKPDITAITAFLEKHPDSKYAHFGTRGEGIRIK
jgi:hypothetical protein